MCTISSTEFKNNFGKYIELSEREEIIITKRGRIICRMIPERMSLIEEAKSLFNIFPENATIGNDPDERG